MDPLLFADHLRRLRDGPASATKGQGLDLARAGGLIAAACTACLLLVMLQAALSAPLPEAPSFAALVSQEIAR
jgi:hypothetical protein